MSRRVRAGLLAWLLGTVLPLHARPEGTRDRMIEELRASFVEAYGRDFELVADAVREKDGTPFWLAFVRPKRSGEFVFRHRFETPGYGYRYHDNEMRVFVSEKGSRRELRNDLRPQTFCVGDTVIIPILVAERVVNHSFRRDSRFPQYYTSPFQNHLDERAISSPAQVRGPDGSPVLRYLGRESRDSVHRGGDRTSLSFTAFFEAIGVGRLDLELTPRLPPVLAGPGDQPQRDQRPVRSIVVVPADAPITAIVHEESVWQTNEASDSPRSSSSGGTSYPVSVLMLRPGDRFSLTYGGLTAPSRREVHDAAPEVEPAIRVGTFRVDGKSGFTAWLPEPPPETTREPYLR